MSKPAHSGAAAPEPGLFRRAWTRWKEIAHAIGLFQTRVIMSVLYFIIILPVGVLARLVSDPLHLREPKGTNWERLESHPRTLESAHQQF
jgi:hypothetical protein